MDTKKIQGTRRFSKGATTKRYRKAVRMDRLRKERVKYPSRSYTYSSKCSAESISIQNDANTKRKTAIKIFKSYPGLKKKPYWGNHFWSKGYCVDTIGLDEEKIKKYVKYQEDIERKEEQQEFKF